MTYNVLMGTLNPTHSLTHAIILELPCTQLQIQKYGRTDGRTDNPKT